jgi:hypothetical protein
MKGKLPPGTLDRLWEDSRHWTWGFLFYCCPQDPRLLVPKRQKWAGWTLNCAHASSWALLALIVAGIAFPAIALARAGLVLTWVWCVFLTACIALACGLSIWLASPRRFEARDARIR